MQVGALLAPRGFMGCTGEGLFFGRCAILGCLGALSACSSGAAPGAGGTAQNPDASVTFDVAGSKADAKPSDSQASVDVIGDAVVGDAAVSADAADATAAEVLGQDVPPPECGDGICNGDETTMNCYSDCPVTAMCGDGLCNGVETSVNCLGDCPTGSPVCGDGLCQKPEGPVACPVDCDPFVVGIIACLQAKCPAATASCTSNQVCYGVLGEAAKCLSTCAGRADCLDWCKSSVAKTALAVPVVDCGFDACLGAGAAAICGDGACAAPESKAACPADCGGPPTCGDGACTAPESMAGCPADCKPA